MGPFLFHRHLPDETSTTALRRRAEKSDEFAPSPTDFIYIGDAIRLDLDAQLNLVFRDMTMRV